MSVGKSTLAYPTMAMVITGFKPPDQTAWQKNISAWWLMNASGME